MFSFFRICNIHTHQNTTSMEDFYSIHEIKAADAPARLGNSSWHFRASWTNRGFSLTYPDHDDQLQRFRWYLETHALADPLNTWKAAQIRKELDNYADQLVRSLPAIPERPSRTLFLDVYDCGDDSTGHSIPWELLEGSGRMRQRSVVIRRRVTGAVMCSPPRDPTPKTFNMLFMAARKEGDDEEYQHASLPILRLIQDLPDGASFVNFEMVRPGRYQALVEHLERAAAGKRDIHLVHLDMHGEVSVKDGWVIYCLSYLCGYANCFTSARLIFSDRSVPATKVAQLLKKHGIKFVVLNACESARGDKGLKANLAKTFVQEGIAAVLAMSYKLNVSVVTLFTHHFYDALLRQGFSWARAASSVREAMRAKSVHKGRFGLQIDLQDWIVPVVYSSTDDDPIIKTSERVSKVQRKRFPFLGRTDGLNTTGFADLAGRDADVLKIEEKLLDNARDRKGQLLFLEGKMGVGKTSLLHYLQWWWVSTGMVTNPIYVNMDEHRDQSPEQVCSFILRKLGQTSRDKEISTHDATRQLRDYLSDMLGSDSNPALLYPRPLLIFDRLWSFNWPLGKRSGVPDASFWVQWKAFFKSLLESPAYTIVASHRWPWYLDDHPTSEFEPQTIYILPPLTLSRMDVALKVGRNYATLDGLLKNSKDIEHLDLILEWAGHDTGLVSVFLPFVKEVGVERAAKALIMGEDIISCPEIRGSAIKQLPAYEVARRFWKKAPNFFREMLMGFAPFHNYLPRCHESYSRDFTINKQTSLHPIFNFFSKYNPEAAQQTTNILSMQLVGESTAIFVPILKSMGLIRAESMMGSSNMQSGLPVTFGQQAPEGIMLHSIHPVFSLFLRHQAKKAKFMLWPENGGKQSRKSMCLEKTFVDYHEDRALEWMEQRSISSTNVWDSTMEADLCKNSFIAAMEIKLRSPSGRYDVKNITPTFLFWCWSTKDRDQSMLSPVSMEYLAGAAERALVNCRTHLDMFRCTIAPAGLTIDEYLGTAKEGVQLCILLALHCIFNSAQDNKLAYYTSAADEILKRCDALGSLRNNYHFPDRILMEEQLDKIRRVQNETGPNRMILQAELLTLDVGAEDSSPSAQGWKVIEKSLSIMADFRRMRTRSVALAFWNADEEREQLEILSKDADSFLTELAPILPDFLSTLGSDMLVRFRMLGFSEEDDKVMIRDTFWDGLYEDYLEWPAYLRLPNYSSAFMAAIRNGTSTETVHREFDQTWEKWLESNARPFGLHTFEMSLEQEGEMQKTLLEMKQIAFLQHLDDWPLVFEHLDSLVVRERAVPLQSLSETQLSRVAWWQVNKGLAALRMCAWKECLQHINAILEMLSERNDLDPSQHFTALHLLVLLYSKAPSSLQSGMTTATEAVFRALFLGYTERNEAIYARNGALLSVLLRLGMEDPDRGDQNALNPEVCSQLEYILSRRSDPTFWSTTPANHLIAIRTLKSSRSSFPLSAAFLSTFHGDLGSESDPRLVLSQAESHLFLNTPFPKHTQHKQHKPDAPLLTAIAKLPLFDLERAFKPVHAGRLESVHSLMTLSMLHKAENCRVTDETEEEVVMEEQGERRLGYLGRWHAAARD